MPPYTGPALPPGWKYEWDVTHQDWFYVDLSTGSTQWVNPVTAVSRELPQGWDARWDARHDEWFYYDKYTGQAHWERPRQRERRVQERPSPSESTKPTDSLPDRQVRSAGVTMEGCSQKTNSRTKEGPPHSDATRPIRSMRDVLKPHTKASNTQPPKESSRGVTTPFLRVSDKATSVLPLAETSDRPVRSEGEELLQRMKSLDESFQRMFLSLQAPYEVLFDDNDFRILQLQPGSPSESLSGTLLQPTNLEWGIQYDALSYRWSEVHPTDPASINIDGVQLLIGPSLHAALVRFRHEMVPRRLWVDQVCINQNDEREKIGQIKIMGDIYRKAQKVLVWLGDANEQSDVAMEFFPIFVEQVRRNEITARLQHTTEPPADIVDWRGTLALAMKRLFERPWFGRVWTLQEATLGKNAEIWCGDKSFPFQVLETFQRGYDDDLYGHWASALTSMRSATSGDDPENPSRPLNAHIHIISVLKGRSSSSVRILNSLRHLDCGDDKDRIYSILRFLSADLVEEVVRQQEPSPAELYRLVATHELQHGHLEYLGAAGLSQHRMSYVSRQQCSSKTCLSLPSWVPDWTFKIRTHSYWVQHRDRLQKRGYSLFAAGGPPSSEPLSLLPNDGKVLRIRGAIMLSKVDECGTPFRVLQLSNDVSDQEVNLVACKTMFEMIQAYTAECLELAAKCNPKYGTSNTKRACRRSLIGGMMPEGGGNTNTATCVPATDQVVDQLFEDFEEWVSYFEEGLRFGVAARQRLAKYNGPKNGTETLPQFTDEEQAQVMKYAKWTEASKNNHKKNNLIQAMADACKGRRFFITDCRCYMGMAPDLTEPGDEICLIPGCCAPFVIRPKVSRYQLVGECYVAGIMDGEVVASGKYEARPILLD